MKLTFTDIDKTTIRCASDITQNLLRCKQAIDKVVSYVDYLSGERVISLNHPYDSNNKANFDTNDVILFKDGIDVAIRWLNHIIINHIDEVLIESEYTEI